MGTNSQRFTEKRNHSKIDGQPKAEARFASKRADGTINTHPQERMRASNHEKA
ncbi:small, acid-soluble spore protein K [Ectobacillus panaciterrae]|uniref:small, acid-soluble spore protein K n=1 Tax=Ectobacillus panaciterrae TaxID=363872 RepID=UPI0003FF8E51|nr:small, acid-soluble spore protein K [Ectobacillus panaciterrae]